MRYSINAIPFFIIVFYFFKFLYSNPIIISTHFYTDSIYGYLDDGNSIIYNFKIVWNYDQHLNNRNWVYGYLFIIPYDNVGINYKFTNRLVFDTMIDLFTNNSNDTVLFIMSAAFCGEPVFSNLAVSRGVG